MAIIPTPPELCAIRLHRCDLHTAWKASLALLPMSISCVLLVFILPLFASKVLAGPRLVLALVFLGMATLHFILSKTPAVFAAPVLLLILFIQPYISVVGINLGINEVMKRAPAGDHGTVAGILYATVQIVGGFGLALMIAAKDGNTTAADAFARFSNSFTIGVIAAAVGTALVMLALRRPAPNSQLIRDKPDVTSS